MKHLYIPLLLLGCLFSACNNNSHSEHAAKAASHSNHSDHSHHAAASANMQASTGYTTEMSLYNLTSNWATQKGDSIKLESLKGKVQLVAMIYTSCDYACPRIVADLKRIEESLSEYKKEEVGIVLVSLDPKRDTPIKLKEFAVKNKLDPTRWLFLTSQDNNILELAALLNVKYRKELSMDIAHSNIISVLNKDGEVIHQQEGLGVDPSETVDAISGLLKRI